jgi:hypothetical protein
LEQRREKVATPWRKEPRVAADGKWRSNGRFGKARNEGGGWCFL